MRALRKVLWRGSKWIVTPWAIICPSRSFVLRRRDAGLRWSQDESFLDWPVRVARTQKWADLEEFGEAYRFAVREWGVDVSDDWITVSFAFGMKVL